MNKSRSILAVVISGAAILALAGCSPISDDEITTTPGTVFEVVNADWNVSSEFDYVNSDRQIVHLNDCGQPSWFDQRYCDSENGVYHFQWSIGKGGRIGSASMTENGVKTDLSCYSYTKPDDAWTSWYYCLSPQ